MKNKFVKLVIVVGANLLLAAAVKLFIMPSDLVSGGTTGVGLALNHFFGISVGTFVLILNVIMLLLGLVCLGKSFALTTLTSTFLYPVFLEILDRSLGDLVLTEDPMINTVFAGLGVGVSIGLMVQVGASTGGMDIPPLILNRYLGLPVSAGMYIFDGIIILVQAFFSPIEMVLYGLILLILSTVAVDKVVISGSSRIEVKVVTKDPDKLRNLVLKQVNRGCTLISAETGYREQETRMVFTVISHRELPRVKRLFQEADPECFMVITQVSEVRGRGFTLKRQEE
ncbi:MAG: YitT family protein [Lachnospiraceae bacterium]|nr:YitT family protein [Lachnospiraceae bacterium]